VSRYSYGRTIIARSATTAAPPGLSCCCISKYARNRDRGNVAIPKGLPRSVGRWKPGFWAFRAFYTLSFPWPALETRITGITVIAKARFGNRNHLSEMPAIRPSDLPAVVLGLGSDFTRSDGPVGVLAQIWARLLRNAGRRCQRDGNIFRTFLHPLPLPNTDCVSHPTRFPTGLAQGRSPDFDCLPEKRIRVWFASANSGLASTRL
jgi:hypothetical protein